VQVGSSGLHARESCGADERAVRVARDLGILLEDHRARSITGELIDQADVVFVMDRTNEARLLARFPRADRKVFLLGRLANSTAPADIVDPYLGSIDDVRSCAGIIQGQVRFLARALDSTAIAGESRTPLPPLSTRARLEEQDDKKTS